MINCKVCKKDFYPYLGSRVFCSMKCYKEQKHLDNIANWKKKRALRIATGKPCRRCKVRFSPEFNNSSYCSTCKEILMDKPKKNVIEVEEKICKDCSNIVTNTDIRVHYCEPCRELKKQINNKKTHAAARRRSKQVAEANKVRGKSKAINPKFLTRGTPSGGNRVCAISQEA